MTPVINTLSSLEEKEVNQPAPLKRKPPAITELKEADLEKVTTRFWKNAVRKSEDECWEWTGQKDKDGYGRFSYFKKNVGAHRFSFQLSNATINPDKLVCHSCDNPSCINPKHLWQGTHFENTWDCIRKGRFNAYKDHPNKARPGHLNINAKLKAGQAEQLRDLRSQGYHVKQLSEIFKIALPTVYRVCSRKSYKE